MEALLCISLPPTINLSLVVGSLQLRGTQIFISGKPVHRLEKIWLFHVVSCCFNRQILTNLSFFFEDLLQAGSVILVVFASLVAMRSWPPVCYFRFPTVEGCTVCMAACNQCMMPIQSLQH
jgi:hypothetical protein